MNKFFIQSNNSQILGAHLAKYSIERFFGDSDDVAVEILHVEHIPEFQNFVGKTYKHGSELKTYSFSDEQSFALTRFMPPEKMNYEGRAVVIDPDIFAVQDVRPLFELDLGKHTVACCDRANGTFWDTSVMLLECSKLTHWKTEHMLQNLNEEKFNYTFATRKVFDEPILKISRDWNKLDEINKDTKFIHMTRQRTQPWKTGLPYTVTPRKLGKAFGLIPKEWLPYGKEKYPKNYQEHPSEEVKDFFFTLVKEALETEAIDKAFIEEEVAKKHIRPDIFEIIS